MDIQRCYAILELSDRAGPDELKMSYRRLAFACHPDLHPEDPRAADKFRRLNEAYVTLLDHFETNGQQTASSSASGQRARGSHRPTSGRYRQASGEKTRTGPSAEGWTRSGGRHNGQRQGFRQEDILKNILKDPFARQVFEDIFRRVKRDKTDEPARRLSGPARKSLSLKWGSRHLELDLSRLGPRGVKKWLRSQLDHEQTLHLPPSRLMPGTTLSITVRHGLRGGSQTVSTTIPPDYAAGRPLRLKALGRKLGPWRGDLYLRLLAK